MVVLLHSRSAIDKYHTWSLQASSSASRAASPSFPVAMLSRSLRESRAWASKPLHLSSASSTDGAASVQWLSSMAATALLRLLGLHTCIRQQRMTHDIMRKFFQSLATNKSTNVGARLTFNALDMDVAEPEGIRATSAQIVTTLSDLAFGDSNMLILLLTCTHMHASSTKEGAMWHPPALTC